MHGRAKDLAVEEDGVAHYLKHRWNENAVTLCDKVLWFEPSPNNKTAQICQFVSDHAAAKQQLHATCILCIDLDGRRE